MTLDEIENLVRQAQAADGGRFEHGRGGARLVLSTLHRGGTEHEASASPPADRTIRAPATGVFFARHPSSPPGAPAPVALAKSAIAGYLRVGPCLRPVVATRDCVVVRPLAEDGTLAGYGAPLLVLAAD